MIIYKTTNTINKKFYIGKDTRDNPEYLGSGILLHKAIKKYGIQNFQKEIIEECLSLEQLNEREKFWIKILNATDRRIGYNIALGGEGGDTITNNPNRIHVKSKMSLAKKGNRLSEQCLAAATQSRKLKHPGYGTEVDSEVKKEYRRKHSQLLKQHVKEKGKWNVGEKRSEQTCKNIGDSKRGEKHPRFGKHLDEDLKNKLKISGLKAKNPHKIKIIGPDKKETIVNYMSEAEIFMGVIGCRNYIRQCLRHARAEYKQHKFEYLVE